MNKSIMAFCLIFLPFQCVAHSFAITKLELIEMAEEHRFKAKLELEEVMRASSFIPDLSKKEHMHTLISSVIFSMSAPNPQGKFLAIGLALIGSMAVELFDMHAVARQHLLEATHHLEMLDFLNKSSLCYGNCSTKDKGTRSFLNAIDYLTFCEIVATAIENEDEKQMLVENISYFRRQLISMFNNPKRHLNPKNLYRESCYFTENVDEILSEIQDSEVIEEIQSYTYSMMDEMAEACKLWGAKI